MRNTLVLLAAIALFACKRQDPEPDIPFVEADTTNNELPTPKRKPNTAATAGESIGNISLEMDASNLEEILGKPDLSDSAMGKSWMTWYSDNSKAVSGKAELNVYTAYKDNEMKQKVVRLIRATSPEFEVDSVGSGKMLADVKSHFPQIRNVGDYAFGKTKEIVSIYDDQQNGVAFEFVKDSCISVIVHPKGKDVTLDYRMFRPDMTIR